MWHHLPTPKSGSWNVSLIFSPRELELHYVLGTHPWRVWFSRSGVGNVIFFKRSSGDSVFCAAGFENHWLELLEGLEALSRPQHVIITATTDICIVLCAGPATILRASLTLTSLLLLHVLILLVQRQNKNPIGCYPDSSTDLFPSRGHRNPKMKLPVL